MFTTIQVRKKWAKKLKQLALDREKPLWQIIDEILSGYFIKMKGEK